MGQTINKVKPELDVWSVVEDGQEIGRIDSEENGRIFCSKVKTGNGFVAARMHESFFDACARFNQAS